MKNFSVLQTCFFLPSSLFLFLNVFLFLMAPSKQLFSILWAFIRCIIYQSLSLKCFLNILIPVFTSFYYTEFSIISLCLFFFSPAITLPSKVFCLLPLPALNSLSASTIFSPSSSFFTFPQAHIYKTSSWATVTDILVQEYIF